MGVSEPDNSIGAKHLVWWIRYHKFEPDNHKMEGVIGELAHLSLTSRLDRDELEWIYASFTWSSLATYFRAT